MSIPTRICGSCAAGDRRTQRRFARRARPHFAGRRQSQLPRPCLADRQAPASAGWRPSARPREGCRRVPLRPRWPPARVCTADRGEFSHDRLRALSRARGPAHRAPSCGKYPTHVADGTCGSSNRAGHLRLPDPLPIADVDLGHSPPGRRRAQHHLERVSEPAIDETEREQRLTSCSAHRAEVAQRPSGARPDLSCQQRVRKLARVAARRAGFRRHVDRARCRLPRR